VQLMTLADPRFNKPLQSIPESFLKFIKRCQPNGLKYLHTDVNFKQDCIILSHVIEYLYEPKSFIQKCLHNQVKTIFLSIPSIENLHVGKKYTFLYNSQDISYLFGIFHYKVKDFLSTSPYLFFHFVLDGPQQIEQYIEPRHLYSIRYFKSFRVPKNTFLTSCDMYSFVLYPWIENKEDIIGVVDENPHKQGTQFSYTVWIVQPYKILDKQGNTALVNHLHRIHISSMIHHASILEH